MRMDNNLTDQTGTKKRQLKVIKDPQRKNSQQTAADTKTQETKLTIRKNG